MQQQREAILKEKETAERIAARAFAQSYLADLVPSVFSTLNQNGFFYDPVERGTKNDSFVAITIIIIGTEVETVFMPFLMEEAEKSLHKKLVARTLLDGKSRDLNFLNQCTWYSFAYLHSLYSCCTKCGCSKAWHRVNGSRTSCPAGTATD